jgi:uncharacterized membrane protein YhaH (DUF805 family)
MPSLLRFDGRIGRLEFVLTWLGVAIGVYLAAFTFIVATGAGDETAFKFTEQSRQGAAMGGAVFVLQALWLLSAAACKRCHDRDHSGWRALISPTPVIGQLWLLLDLVLAPGTAGPNRYGVRNATPLSISATTA